jgi:hypothetical protein
MLHVGVRGLSQCDQHSRSTLVCRVVPANDKENARLIVSQIILDTLNGLEMTYPEVSAERRKELQSIRERLTNGDLD